LGEPDSQAAGELALYQLAKSSPGKLVQYQLARSSPGKLVQYQLAGSSPGELMQYQLFGRASLQADAVPALWESFLASWHYTSWLG
jgi:hypothetical protein